MKALSNGAAEIYIYDEIGYWGVTAKDFANDLKEYKSSDIINLRINSPGGSVTDGIAIYNLLKSHSAKINVQIDGLAASMASTIAMAGDTITMPENALMMIHNPWGYATGDSEEMRKTADVLDKMKKALLSAYSQKTGLNDADIDELMTAETWMTGGEAVEMGFADQVTDEIKLAASFDPEKLNQFKNQSILKPLTTAVSTKPKEVKMTTKTKAAPVAGKTTEPQAAVVAPVIDAKAIEAKAIETYQANQVARKQEIRAAFSAHASSHAELLNSCLDDDNCDVNQARASLLDALGAQAKPQKGGYATAHAGNGDIVKQSMVGAIKSRAGIKMQDGELSSDNPFKAMTLAEMARESLTQKGVGVASIGTRMELVGSAFTHGNSDFGNVLADVANKAMLMGYDSADETFQEWTSTGSLSDFKTSKRVGLNTFPSLREVRPGAEYKHATVGDRGEDIVLATYGEQFSINRQAIINDDLSAFTRIPSSMGRAAIRTVGDLVYAILTSNPNMSDNTALFHSNHANLGTGALSIESLTAGRTAMKLQKDATGSVLNIRPEFLLVPVSLETDADTFMNDTVHAGKNNSQRNPIRGMATVIADPRLDANSSAEWYLAAGQGFDTIEVAYLDGQSTPFIDQMEGWNVDGTSFKVRLDAGVSPLDFRTFYKSTGA